jgi:hypothetical protein
VYREAGDVGHAKFHYQKALDINSSLEAAKKRLAEIEKQSYPLQIMTKEETSHEIFPFIFSAGAEFSPYPFG